VACAGGYVLTACYDSTVNIFDAATGQKMLTVPGHEAPARAVTWVQGPNAESEDTWVFASAAHDQTVLLYRWNAAANAVEAVNALRGHSRSVDCLAVKPTQPSLLASGSFDTTLKIWGATPSERTDEKAEDEEDQNGGESQKKKTKSSGKKPVTRTPITTLAGHREGVTGVAWLDDGTVATCSMDHTIKVWDVAELQGVRTEMAGDRAFLSLSFSEAANLLLTTSADSAVRSYDPRAKSGDVLVRGRYACGAPGWMTSVSWQKGSGHLFAAGGHDAVVRIWDLRSARTPLYELRGHDERVLAVDWSQPQRVASGGADCSLKMFTTGEAAKTTASE
jgi:ribosome biogenesis protein YTM1